ncbi:unnamed protein product [Prunus armeniaca]
MKEDTAKCVATDEVRADAEEHATGAVEQMVLIEQNEAVVCVVDQEVAKGVIG